MGKYFATDLEAKEWAAAKFQALYRGREHRRLVERHRLELVENQSLVVDVCSVGILGEKEGAAGYEERMVEVESRRFRENAGDGKIALLKTALKKGSVDPVRRGFRGERAAHRAAENGHVECLRLAIEAGHDVDDGTELKNTAAHYAAMGGANDCVR